MNCSHIIGAKMLFQIKPCHGPWPPSDHLPCSCRWTKLLKAYLWVRRHKRTHSNTPTTNRVIKCFHFRWKPCLPMKRKLAISPSCTWWPERWTLTLWRKESYTTHWQAWRVNPWPMYVIEFKPCVDFSLIVSQNCHMPFLPQILFLLSSRKV